MLENIRKWEEDKTDNNNTNNLGTESERHGRTFVDKGDTYKTRTRGREREREREREKEKEREREREKEKEREREMMHITNIM